VQSKKNESKNKFVSQEKLLYLSGTISSGGTMVTRREFLKTASVAAGAAVLPLRKLSGTQLVTQYFGLHDFIESHPEAVFILRTTVSNKTDTAGIKDVGYLLGQNLFVAKTDAANAFPISTNVVLKPNITSWSWDKPPIESTMGIQTDPYFVEGIISALKDLTLPAQNIYLREANFFPAQSDGQWYAGLAQRTGVNFKAFNPVAQLAPEDLQWVDVPEGIWYRRIPYLWPVNSGGSCLINIAKLKSHSMGITLCSKNLQGTNARPYVAHCTAWGGAMTGVNAEHIAPDAFTTIRANYNRHTAAGIPRWSTLDGDPGAGSQGGLWQETHVTRCLDNNSVLHPLLNIIEGVYGREGPFVSGPQDNNWYGRDIMTNVVIFGKNARHVDIIGTYLAGHEPGNFGLFHIARERGLSSYLDPRTIPLYEWKLDGSAVATPVSSFPRTLIRTLYLPQPGEDQYHMVDEPFDYSTTSAGKTGNDAPRLPSAIAISQNFPNPFNPTTSIQYSLPTSGYARLEIFDVQGEVMDVLVDGHMSAGDHLQAWNASRRASGTYFYRLTFNGASVTKSMVLIR
jgi:uncharacterized protein (DUF362 family)